MSGRPYPDRFYPVVDDVAWVRRLIDLGVGTVQIRAKGLGREDATVLITSALAAVRGSRTRLVVNDYRDAAIVAGAEHVHLGQEDLAGADVGAIRRAGMTLGISTHDGDELETALGHDPDYIALGPIYPTTLKAMRFGPPPRCFLGGPRPRTAIRGHARPWCVLRGRSQIGTSGRGCGSFGQASGR